MHSDINTTAIYAQNQLEDLQEMVDGIMGGKWGNYTDFLR